MNATFLGGTDIGATCLWFQTDHSQWLVDAGARMDEQNPLPDLARLERENARIEAIFITHAHHDHIGALPIVSHLYPDAPVFMTAPTADIARIMLQDALRLGEREGKPGLFSEAQLLALWDRVRLMPQDRPMDWQGFKVVTYTAGHILGAVSIGFATDEGRVLVTGDVSVTPGRLIGGARIPHGDTYDVVIAESTYGARLHDSRAVQERTLVEQVAQVVQAGGFVLIPAFAVGRAQEVLMILLDAMAHNRSIPKFPLVVDGLVRVICPVYESYPHLLRGPVKRTLHEKGRLFPRDDVQFIRRSEERRSVLQGKPACIISSSGMLNGGPSVQYAQAIMGNDQNAVFLCGYQDEESPGRQLLRLTEQAPEERRWILSDRVVPMKARVELYGLSAHADRRELAQLIGQVKPQAVWLVHGDDEAKRGLAQELAACAVQIPRVGDTLSVRQNTPGRTVLGAIRPGHIALFAQDGAQDDALALGVIQTIDRQGVDLLQADQTVAYTTSDRILETFGRVPVGEASDRYLQGLWNAAQACVAEDRLYGNRPAERLAYHLARQQETASDPNAAELHEIARMLEPYAWRKMESDPMTGQHRVFVAFPWAVPQEVRTRVEARTWDGWPYRVEPFVHAPTLLRRVQEVLSAHGVTATVGSPRLFTEEQRIVLPLYGDLPDTARVLIEQTLTAVVGGAVTLDVETQAPALSRRVEQNEAMRTAKSLLPESFRTTKVGVDPAAGILRITVCFPDAVTGTPEAKACEAHITRETGWRLAWGTTTNQAQLALLARTCIEEAGGHMGAQPSLRLDQKAVEVKTTLAGAEWARAGEAFRAATGWALIRHATVESGGQAQPIQPGAMTMHDALTWIERAAAEDGITLYRKSWYGDRVELGFLTPEWGRTHAKWLAACAEHIGVPVQVAQSVNQQALMDLADQLLREAGIPSTGPSSVYLADQTVAVRVAGTIPAEVLEAFRAQTGGWALRVR